MTSEKERSPLLVEEDWWTVWFGLAILLIATVLRHAGAVRQHLGQKGAKDRQVGIQSRRTSSTQRKRPRSMSKKAPHSRGWLTPSTRPRRARPPRSFPTTVASGCGWRPPGPETDRRSPLPNSLPADQRSCGSTRSSPIAADLGAAAFTSQILPSADVEIGSGQAHRDSATNTIDRFPTHRHRDLPHAPDGDRGPGHGPERRRLRRWPLWPSSSWPSSPSSSPTRTPSRPTV